MIRFARLLSALAAICVASPGLASTIGLTGSPLMTIYWQNGTGGPTRTVGAIQFTVDEDGNFSTGPQSFHWGFGAEQDTINVGFVAGNLDPVITMAVGFVDAGSPSVFTFAISSPLSPTITGTTNYKLDLSGSFADGASDGGSMGAGTASFGIMDGQTNFVSFAGIGTPLGGFTAGGSSSFTFPQVAGTTNCGAGCTDFGLFLSAKGSGGNDAMSFTGRLELDESGIVPVPGAVWLLGSALGMLGWLRRRVG